MKVRMIMLSPGIFLYEEFASNAPRVLVVLERLPFVSSG